ncbi:MAG: extracellular solute-binding protein family 1 [Thermomicrobiales bacterium]|jgi:multiple sugar transport system substrate-binding protein|nr:extracellular solute-binding protein family 1 [Thermomicrobiales bacterium]
MPQGLRMPLNRRRMLQASGAAGLALGSGLRLGSGAGAQEITFSRDYEGTTLNLLMEDLLETQIIEDMLPEFTEMTGITVNFEKVAYGVMHEKLVPQLAAGPGNGTYDVLEVDFYWVYEFARSGWVEDLGQRIADSGGAIDLSRYIPATLDIVSQADGKTWYVPFYAYPMGLIYRDDLLNDESFQAEFEAASGMELVIPDSVEGYVELATAISAWKGEEMYGAAMTAQQVDPIVMEFCNFLYSAGGDYYNADLTAPAINDETGVRAAQLYIDCVNNAAQPGAASANYDDSIAVYSQGRAFSSVSFMWMLAVVDGDEEAVAAGKNKAVVMPGGTGLSGAWGWGIPISSPNPDAGWEFVRWVESPDVSLRRALAGSLPTQVAPYEDEDILAKYPWLPQAGEMITAGKGLPAITKQTQLVEIVGRHLADAVAGGSTAQEAMDAAAAELAELL